jgi:pimeloyl-ACP methyl ester carboxylesterase
MPYFEYNSKKIYYEEIGTGFPTIFLHGNTASSKMFANIIPLFSTNFHVVLLDFAGLQRNGYVRYGDEPPVQGVREHYPGGGGRSAGVDGDSRKL